MLGAPTGQVMLFKKSPDPWNSPSPTVRDKDSLPPGFGGGQARSVGTFVRPKLPSITDCWEDIRPGSWSLNVKSNPQMRPQACWSDSSAFLGSAFWTEKCPVSYGPEHQQLMLSNNVVHLFTLVT